MKYANTKTLILVCCCAALLGACTTGPQTTWNYDGSQSVSLMDTEAFLPIRERDEEGQLLPYEAQPNPYTELGGRIDKEAVTTYIDARRAYQAKKYQFADELLAQIIENEPKLSGPWVMRGDIAVDQGKLDKAVEHYAKATEVNSVNFNAYLRLAKTQRQRGHFKHAQNTYAKALAVWPDGPELHLNLGVLYDVYLNQPRQAQAHMEAYQLLSAESKGEAAQWLAEVKQRTGLKTVLMVRNAEGELEIASQEAAPKPENPSKDPQQQDEEKLAVSKVRGE